jgi:hypothetical protein
VIDCDIHYLVGDLDEFLRYVEPGQREWFRTQGPSLGLPGYSWSHPIGWFRGDAEHEPQLLPGSSLAAVRRQVLDEFQLDVGVLNSDDAILLSLMPSP